jgi:outer membrane lipoprotein-sorting protein
MRASENQFSPTRTASIQPGRSATQRRHSNGGESPLPHRPGRAGGLLLSSIALFTVLFAQNIARAQDRIDLDKQLQETEAALAKVDNYTALFHRIERVNGKLVPEQTTFLKFKRPFKIYMRWLSPYSGREALYIAGANNNKVRAHGTGLAGLFSVNLNPAGGLAMKNSRHPITEAGLETLIKKIGADLRRGLQAGELTAIDHGEQMVYGRKTRELEGVLPKDPAKGYYCYRCIVNLDAETRMPIKTQIFDWENQLIECYGYEHLRLNPGLSDKDFDPQNPDYHF